MVPKTENSSTNEGSCEEEIVFSFAKRKSDSDSDQKSPRRR